MVLHISLEGSTVICMDNLFKELRRKGYNVDDTNNILSNIAMAHGNILHSNLLMLDSIFYNTNSPHDMYITNRSPISCILDRLIIEAMHGDICSDECTERKIEKLFEKYLTTNIYSIHTMLEQYPVILYLSKYSEPLTQSLPDINVERLTRKERKLLKESTLKERNVAKFLNCKCDQKFCNKYAYIQDKVYRAFATLFDYSNIYICDEVSENDRLTYTIDKIASITDRSMMKKELDKQTSIRASDKKRKPIKLNKGY